MCVALSNGCLVFEVESRVKILWRAAKEWARQQNTRPNTDPQVLGAIAQHGEALTRLLQTQNTHGEAIASHGKQLDIHGSALTQVVYAYYAK